MLLQLSKGGDGNCIRNRGRFCGRRALVDGRFDASETLRTSRRGGQRMSNHIQQRFAIDRLGGVVIHAGVQTAVAIPLDGIGGQGNDRNSAQHFMGELTGRFHGTNLASGFKAVHHRHLAIHQNERVRPGF